MRGDLWVSDRFGGNQVRLEGSDLRCSWEISRAGSLSVMVPSSVCLELGIRRGMWMRYEPPSARPWGGILTARRRAPVWELAAESFHVLIRKRRTNRLFRALSGTPGGLARRTLQDANLDDYLGLSEVIVDDGGDGVLLDARALDLYGEALPFLTRSGYEWDIDADRIFRFQRQVGVDRSASVHLCEGRHIVDGPVDDDLWAITNDWLGVPAKRGYAEAKGYQEEDSDSIRTYGRLQDTMIVNQINKGATTTLLRQALTKSANPLPTIPLTLADVDNCFSWFGIGDTVRVTLGSAGLCCDWRAMSLALDDTAGTMTCAGDVVRVHSEAVP